MHEDQIQKISQFLDDELPQEEALSLLLKLRTHSELNDKLRRYEVIRHAITNDTVSVSAKPDFVAAVSSRIQHEPTYLIPNAARRLVHQQRYKIAAAAASIAVIALAAHTQRPEQSSKMQVAAVKPSVKQVSPANESKTLVNSYPASQQINDYLQAHNSIYIGGQVDLKPYAKVTHLSQK